MLYWSKVEVHRRKKHWEDYKEEEDVIIAYLLFQLCEVDWLLNYT